MKFLMTKDCDYVMGHLRYGHLETEIGANSLDEAMEIAKTISNHDMELIIDDYRVDDYNADDEFELTEIK